MTAKRSTTRTPKATSEVVTAAGGVVIDERFTQRLIRHLHRGKKRALTENVLARATRLSPEEKEVARQMHASFSH